MGFYLPYAVLAVFFLTAMWMVRRIEPAYNTMASANHAIPWTVAALSIMATFAAPNGLLQAGGFGYSSGMPGLIVYVAVYMLVYLAYAWFASSLKRDHPDSLTISDVLRTGIGKKTGLILRTQYTIGPVYGVLLNLTGLKLITDMWGYSQFDSFLFMTISMIAVLIYCWNGGLASSIKTDLMQSGLLVITSLVIFAIVMFGTPNIAGLEAAAAKPWTSNLLINPGVLFLFILGGALFSDVEMFNRAAAAKDVNAVRKSFIGAAVIAGVVMAAYGIMGALGAPGIGNKDQAIVQVITQNSWLVQTMFMFALIALLVANLDSSVVANGIIVTHEWAGKHDITLFRQAMVVTAIAGLALTFLGLSLIHILMGWACYRLSTLPAVVAFAARVKFDDKTWAWSFLAAVVVGAGIVFTSFYNKLGLTTTLWGYVAMLVISSIGVFLGRNRGSAATA